MIKERHREEDVRRPVLSTMADWGEEEMDSCLPLHHSDTNPSTTANGLICFMDELVPHKKRKGPHIGMDPF